MPSWPSSKSLELRCSSSSRLILWGDYNIQRWAATNANLASGASECGNDRSEAVDGVRLNGHIRALPAFALLDELFGDLFG